MVTQPREPHRSEVKAQLALSGTPGTLSESQFLVEVRMPTYFASL